MQRAEVSKECVVHCFFLLQIGNKASLNALVLHKFGVKIPPSPRTHTHPHTHSPQYYLC